MPAPAGSGVALFCDIRIVDETAMFGVFSRRWGVPMSDGTTVRLPRIVGQGRALDMLLTGRAVGADEAIAIGPGHAQGGARHDARRGREARARDRGLPADRHDLGPPVGLRELRPRPGRPRCGARWNCRWRRGARNRRKGAARFAQGEGRHGKFERR